MPNRFKPLLSRLDVLFVRPFLTVRWRDFTAFRRAFAAVQGEDELEIVLMFSLTGLKRFPSRFAE